MNVLLLEYITGGGLAGEPLPDSLRREGLLMAAALVQDLLAMPEVDVVMPWDGRLAPPSYAAHPRVRLEPVADRSGFVRIWRRLLSDCEAAWPVAPESGGLLASLCDDVAMAGKPLLTSPAAAVALASSKAATCRRLLDHGIAAIPTYPLAACPNHLPLPWVIKPDDGAGCEGSWRVNDQAELAWPGRAVANAVVQPYVAGDSLSLSALFWAGDALLLAVNRQQVVVREDGRFALTGCVVNAVADAEGVYAALARRVAHALPELAGYAGVDFLATEQGPVVLEINPRLTSSYAGLGRALGINPAALVVELFQRRSLPRRPGGRAQPVVLSW